jgi:S1-C subfamily serine protease
VPRITCVRRRILSITCASAFVGAWAYSADAPTPSTDWLRATVQIRNGQGRGSGTVFVSRDNETLILTAAHVVRDASDLKVEIHRHNLGFRTLGLTQGGGWPRLVAASVVASDAGADVAVLRVRGLVAMPHVARFEPAAGEPSKTEVMTSVGIDRTLHLNLWSTAVEGSARIDLGRGGGARLFTITSRAPEHGRSGGALFRADGTVAGVCAGQLTIGQGPRRGAFASVESIRALLRDNGLLDAAGRAARRP